MIVLSFLCFYNSWSSPDRFLSEKERGRVNYSHRFAPTKNKEQDQIAGDYLFVEHIYERTQYLQQQEHERRHIHV